MLRKISSNYVHLHKPHTFLYRIEFEDTVTVICCHGDDSLVAELKDSVEVSEILFGCGCTLLISQLHRQLQLLLSKSVRLTVVPKGSVRIAQAPVGSGLSNSNVQEGGGRGEEGGRERREERGGREGEKGGKRREGGESFKMDRISSANLTLTTPCNIKFSVTPNC